jgi:hypothetical protein
MWFRYFCDGTEGGTELVMLSSAPLYLNDRNAFLVEGNSGRVFCNNVNCWNYPLKPLAQYGKSPNGEVALAVVSVMDSCFPPLAALSLRDHRKSNGHQTSNNRQARPSSAQQPSGEGDSHGKIEILQDLDLYYIRQIAHSLKVHDDFLQGRVLVF